MKMFKSLGLLSLLAASSLSYAEAGDYGKPSWDYVSVGYASMDFDANSTRERATFTGYALQGVKSIGDDYFAEFTYMAGDDNWKIATGGIALEANLENTYLKVGAGTKRSFDKIGDVSLSAGYLKYEVTVQGQPVMPEHDNSGVYISAGLSKKMRDTVELFGSVNHRRWEETMAESGRDSETQVSYGARIYVDNGIIISVTNRFIDYGDFLDLSVGYRF